MEDSFLRDRVLKSTKELSEHERHLILESINQIQSELGLKLEDMFARDVSLDTAFIEIGSTSGQGLLGIDALREGKKLFNRYKSKLHKDICSFKLLRAYCENATVIDTVTVAGLILGGLHAAKTYGIDVASTAFIVARLGIKGFCRVQWSND